MDKQDRTIVLLAFFGMLVAFYALSLHFSNDGSKLCNINDTLNCDLVNKSQWAMLFGIPVALLGIFAYAGLIMLVLFSKRLAPLLSFTSRDVWGYIVGYTLFMLGFQVYLTLAEVFWIGAYCIACLANQTILLVLLWRIAQRYRSIH